jgi:hypothetical protein
MSSGTCMSRSPGVYDFTGQNDVAEFLREAQQEGLYVVLRPGPYVCAEWDLGGYPAWLLKDHTMLLGVLRTAISKPVQAMDEAVGQGACAAAGKPRRPDHRRPGGERVRLVLRE